MTNENVFFICGHVAPRVEIVLPVKTSYSLRLRDASGGSYFHNSNAFSRLNPYMTKLDLVGSVARE